MLKLLLILIATIILTGCKPNLPKPGSMQTSLPATSQSQVNYIASFAIFTNGTLRIFTDPKYHNRSADVFLQSQNPNVIQVRKAGITWGDFFQTLPLKLTSTCLTTGTGQTFCSNQQGTLKFYLNGTLAKNFLETEIKNGDGALITFGNETEVEIAKQLKQISQ